MILRWITETEMSVVCLRNHFLICFKIGCLPWNFVFYFFSLRGFVWSLGCLTSCGAIVLWKKCLIFYRHHPQRSHVNFWFLGTLNFGCLKRKHRITFSSLRRLIACDERIPVLCYRGLCVQSFNNKLFNQLFPFNWTELFINMIYCSLQLLIQRSLSTNYLCHTWPSKQVLLLFFKRLIWEQVKFVIFCKV